MGFRSLAFKWTATLVVTSLIGVILVGVFAYRTTITEFDRLRNDQAESLFVQNATRYYQANGTWSGLEAWMNETQGSNGRGGFRPPDFFALADDSGTIVLGRGPLRNGTQLPLNVLDEGTPILIGDEQVGTVLQAQSPPDLDPREQRYLYGTNRALILGALGAGAASLVIGLLLSRQFLRCRS
jgi:two-component system, OmpR family, sensor histidine kinase BaeS